MTTGRDQEEGRQQDAARTWLLGHLSELAALADEGGWRPALDAEMAAFRAGRPALDTLQRLGLDTAELVLGAAARVAISISVPGDLLPDLAEAGISAAPAGQPGSTRGGIENVLTITSIGANLTALVLARDQLGAFLASVRNWMTRRTPPEAGSEFTAEITARHGNDHYDFRLTCRRGSTGQRPQVDVDDLKALLDILLDEVEP